MCAGDTRARRDVKTALHYYGTALYPRYHPEILLSPFNRQSSECETVLGCKKYVAVRVKLNTTTGVMHRQLTFLILRRTLAVYSAPKRDSQFGNVCLCRTCIAYYLTETTKAVVLR